VTLLGLAVFGSIEPPLWDAAWPAFVGSLAILAGWRLRPSGASFLRLVHAPSPGQCSFEPDQDAAAIGPLAGIMVHAAIAAAERTGRRSPCAPCLSDALPFVVPQNGPLVLLQLESFFDARRLGPVVPRGLLPNFDRCVAGSVQHGRLRVPAHGANTVRTEFGVLTGLSPGRLGLDRFNPYADFARVPVDSIAWRLRAAGYRTICIHPFNGRFYNRANIMPNLGFDSFLDISSFPPGPRDGPYVSDSEVVGKIRAVLEACGPRTFVFAITMGNHSPWRRPVMASPPDYPQGGAFAGFLEGADHGRQLGNRPAGGVRRPSAEPAAAIWPFGACRPRDRVCDLAGRTRAGAAARPAGTCLARDDAAGDEPGHPRPADGPGRRLAPMRQL
jgi:hypothetical protein